MPLLQRARRRRGAEGGVRFRLQGGVAWRGRWPPTPDVPPERVAALRRAFDATMKDPDFLAEAERQGMEITPMGGEALQQLVTEIVNAPPAVVEKVRQAVR